MEWWSLTARVTPLAWKKTAETESRFAVTGLYFYDNQVRNCRDAEALARGNWKLLT